MSNVYSSLLRILQFSWCGFSSSTLKQPVYTLNDENSKYHIGATYVQVGGAFSFVLM
uniref:Uncharacterized protein n=1 Tax=Arundo donax TaxID=35708 RepID=A0A0A9AUL7_ARUDO